MIDKPLQLTLVIHNIPLPLHNVLFNDIELILLIEQFISHIHLTATHRQMKSLFLHFSFLIGSLLCQILQLLKSALILFVFFLYLISDKAHVLAGPDNW